MAEAVSRRPLATEAQVRSLVSPCGICGIQSGTGTGYSPRTSVFPCQFHSTGAPLLGKIKKKLIIFHLHHRVAQEALSLRCVSSICCGALLKNESCQFDPLFYCQSRIHPDIHTGRTLIFTMFITNVSI
jgi:hypothetical protein